MPPRISSVTHSRRMPVGLIVGGIFVLGAMAGATLGPYRPWLGAPVRPSPAALPSGGRFPAEVLRVFDGDTFLARVRVAPGQTITAKVRLHGIDAPEREARCPEEAVKAETARRALARILSEGDVTVRDRGPDKYGRILAAVATRGTPDVSAALLRAGLARSYDGGHRNGWCG